MKIASTAALVLSLSAGLSADKIDARLANVHKAFIVAVDEAGDDRLIVACLPEKLKSATAIEVVASKDQADAIFRVKAHIPGAARRYAFGMTGATPSAELEVQLPDGTKLWKDGAKNRTGTGGLIGASRAEDSIACGLAGRLANTLVDAMKKAQTGK